MYKNLFRTMELGVVYHDSNGKIIELNPAASRILGLTKTQISRLDSFSPDWDSIKEDGTPFPGNEHPAIAALRTGKTVKNVVMGILHQKKKKRIWIKINAVPEFKKGREKPYKVYASFADITDEKLAKNHLKKVKKAYKEHLMWRHLGTGN